MLYSKSRVLIYYYTRVDGRMIIGVREKSADNMHHVASTYTSYKYIILFSYTRITIHYLKYNIII
jgi:hypothetical protein